MSSVFDRKPLLAKQLSREVPSIIEMAAAAAAAEMMPASGKVVEFCPDSGRDW